MIKGNKNPIVGIVGNFQRGKSTLVNCLLEGACALTGKRVATTKKSVYYSHGTKFAAFEIDKNGRSTKIPDQKFKSGSVTPTGKVSHYEVEMDCDILRKVSIVDTPGFDNDATDTATTLESLKTLDFVFLVVDKELQKSDSEVIVYLQANSVPFSVIYNCSLNRGAFWSPASTVNKDINTSISSTISRYNSWHVNGSSVTNANFMWYWYAVCKKKGLKAITQEEDEAFADIVHLRLPDPAQMSNVGSIIDFLKGEGLDIRNIQNFVDLRRAFADYQDGILNALKE